MEGKNGATARKHIGSGFMASDHAEAMQRFYAAHFFNPHLNFHRPCGYAPLKAGTRGCTRRVNAADDGKPFEKLPSLPRWQLCLKPGVPAALLRQQASRHSDTDAAKLMQAAKLDLIKRVRM